MSSPKPPQENFSPAGDRAFVCSALTADAVKENWADAYDSASGAPVFANGAVTGAFSYAFNQGMQNATQGGGFSLGGFVKGTLDVVGKIWALPNTLIGLAYGGLGYAAGWAGYAMGLQALPPEIAFGNNAIQFINNPFVRSGEAFTLGNSILYGPGVDPTRGGAYGDPSVIFGTHEMAHTYQQQVLGVFFFPAYVGAGGFVGPNGWAQPHGNAFENGGQAYGSGKGSWWPW